MELSLFNSSQAQEVIELFTEVFSASENESEGQIIGSLVSDLIATTEPELAVLQCLIIVLSGAFSIAVLLCLMTK